MGGFHNDTNLRLFLLLSITLIFSAALPIASGVNIDLYSKDESPFNITYEDWVAKYWNWDYSIANDPQTNTFAGLTQGGCLINKEDSMVMLLDTAAGGIWDQKCTISQNEGIMVPIWTGECNGAEKECMDFTFEQLTKKAREFDLGKVKGEVKVDNMSIAMLDVVDYITKASQNITEITTGEFNATLTFEGHIPVERAGTFPAAAHGWFVFLKPLPPGDHLIYYQNSVEGTSLSGAGNVNTAQITYQMTVK